MDVQDIFFIAQTLDDHDSVELTKKARAGFAGGTGESAIEGARGNDR